MEQKLHTPEGVRDIYNKECEIKLTLQKKLSTVLHSYGYQDIQTPTFEYFDVFRKEIGSTSAREMYKFFDREGNILALRPDITPSIARAVATLFETEDFPIRLCYAGNTFINHSSYQGRLKENTQLGAELIGVDSIEADASADDVLQIRKILEEHNCTTINIISKIENKQGVDNIDEIIKVSDGIMVARGDMGVEIPFEEVPVIQKMIIEKVYMAGKQVITATQMLDSMIKNPRPTRAEAADVANAVYDGTSAIMLSGETAAGLYPVEALKTMVKIAARTEEDINYVSRMKKRSIMSNPDITNAIAHATCTTAMDLNAAAIVTVSNSGRTARMVSKYRPNCPIIGCSVHESVCRQLNLSWGVTPILVKYQETSDELFEHAVDQAEKCGLVKQGELVVLTAGVPLGVSGTTNLIKVHVAGHIIITGKGINDKQVSANLCVAENAAQLREIFKPGDIIVTKDTNNDMMEEIRKASGLIVEAEGANTHAGIVGLSLDLPVILGAKNAVQILKTGAYVTLDGRRGTVSCNREHEEEK